MFDPKKMEELEKRHQDWKSECLQKALDKIKMKAEHFPKQFYTPLDIRNLDHERDLGFPGDFPFTMATHPTAEERQLESLAKIKKERDNRKVRTALDRIRKAAEGTENLMGPVIEAVKLQASMGEICRVLREVFGEYRSYTQL